VVDEVLPKVPIRQCVCSLPWRLRHAHVLDRDPPPQRVGLSLSDIQTVVCVARHVREAPDQVQRESALAHRPLGSNSAQTISLPHQRIGLDGGPYYDDSIGLYRPNS
jgi:hypothetical protein